MILLSWCHLCSQPPLTGEQKDHSAQANASSRGCLWRLLTGAIRRGLLGQGGLAVGRAAHEWISAVPATALHRPAVLWVVAGRTCLVLGIALWCGNIFRCSL